MSKLLKLSGAAYRRLKTSREVTLTKYAVSIFAYVKKTENEEEQMMRKLVNGQKKQDP